MECDHNSDVKVLGISLVEEVVANVFPNISFTPLLVD